MKWIWQVHPVCVYADTGSPSVKKAAGENSRYGTCGCNRQEGKRGGRKDCSHSGFTFSQPGGTRTILFTLLIWLNQSTELSPAASQRWPKESTLAEIMGSRGCKRSPVGQSSGEVALDVGVHDWFEVLEFAVLKEVDDVDLKERWEQGMF